MTLFKPINDQESIKAKYTDVDLNKYNIIAVKKHKKDNILLEQAKDGTHFCVKSKNNGHYFSTLEESQWWTWKTYKMLFDIN